MNNNNFIFQECIKLYNNDSPYVYLQPKDKEKYAKKNICLTYGEILPESVDILINHIDISKDDVFYDLGSGTGKVPLQFFLKTPIQKSYGIEAYLPRHNMAENVYNTMKQTYPQLFNNKQLKSIHNNILYHFIDDATIIFTDSLCFSEELINQLSKKLNNVPNLKYIFSLKKLYLTNFNLQKTIQLKCSWSKESYSNVYMYNTH